MNIFGNKYINILTWGGLGDALLATLAIRALKREKAKMKIRVFALKRHINIYLNNSYIDILKEASFWNASCAYVSYYLGFLSFKSMDYSFTKPSRNYKQNITHVIGEVLDSNISLETKLDVFLSAEEHNRGKELLQGIDEKKIVIGPYTTSLQNKLWFKDHWEELIK
ncbi:MAG: ADP-heptose:LPS heptosyltransferase [Cyclobacteriaceae bacterium]|jgi:ADP-heptose:LPS heptosyltransferase